MKKTIYTIILVLWLPAFLGAQSARKKVMEGNRLYAEEKFDEANNEYQDALLDDPSSSRIQFNVGDVLYQKKNYEKALETYNKALDTDDPLLQSQTYYNIGNTLYRSGKLPESILAYEQALKLNPDDEDAKYNLEFVRNKLKENAQSQPQDQQQQQEQQQKDQEQRQDQRNQDQQKQEQQEQQQDQTVQEEKKEMSKEEAERLLEALKENQEDMKKKQVQGQGKGRVEKDW